MVKIVDHDERRRAIAGAAIALIADVGIEHATLRPIAEKAGVTTGAIAHYFKDKDAVLEAALQMVGARLFALSTNGAEGSKGRPLKYVDILPTNDVSRMAWKVWLAFCGHASYSVRLREIYKRFYTDIETAVAAELKITDRARARDVAATIIAAVDGVGLCATVLPDMWPPERQVARLTELLKPIFSSAETSPK
ncbi:MAG: TetR family transcriptional regulator [Kordiimonadaceae bacterium]|nr:TetR family transcriptional regulator [Kordiimonadaceae bacterium]